MLAQLHFPKGMLAQLRFPKDIPKGMLAQLRFPKGIPKGIPESIPKGIPKGIPEGNPKGIPVASACKPTNCQTEALAPRLSGVQRHHFPAAPFFSPQVKNYK